MKDVRMILPNPASDTAGAASALFQLDGLTVIHDAAGSMESYITFDEQRDIEGKRTVSSHLSRIEAITGDDSILLNKISLAAAHRTPPFIAVIGSPVPFTIGTDLDGIAAEAEADTGVPAFAVTAGGFGTYDAGAGEAIRKVIEKLTHPAETKKGTVNLLGATPMDYSAAEIEGICENLKAQGYEQINTLTVTDGCEGIYRAAEAEHNIVISLAGLEAARFMEKKFSIPYTVGVPVAMPEDISLDGKSVLILGEAVFSKQLAKMLGNMGADAVAGITAGDDKEIFPDTRSVKLSTEKSIREELKKDYFAVIGDPLYKLLMGKDSKAVFIPRCHRALSSRLYKPESDTLDGFISKTLEVLK